MRRGGGESSPQYVVLALVEEGDRRRRSGHVRDVRGHPQGRDRVVRRKIEDLALRVGRIVQAGDHAFDNVIAVGQDAVLAAVPMDSDRLQIKYETCSKLTKGLTLF